MPLFIPILAVFLILGFAFPTTAKFLLFAPILGFVFGGFCWSVLACIFPALISWAIFGWFLVGGIIAAEVIILGVD